MTEEPPAKVLDFFATSRDARRQSLVREAISPSREQPKFRELYGSVNKPYAIIRDLRILITTLEMMDLALRNR